MSRAEAPHPVVWAKLPRAGLGNMLYVWARAVAFASINDGELFTSSWSHLRLGPILRSERSKRLYLRSFRADPISTRLRLLAFRVARQLIHDPPLRAIAAAEARRSIYIFDRLGTEPSDPFRELIPYRAAIIAKFHAMLSERIRSRIDSLDAPMIGIHIRRGDFRNSAWFTPMEHFRDRLLAIRAVAGAEVPATVFSDGTDEELAHLLAVPGVRRAPRQPDVLDLIQLSKSRVIIPSRASTFGMLAGFLSEATIVRDPEWNHGDSRPVEINRRRFEGAPGTDPSQWPSLLVRNLRELTA